MTGEPAGYAAYNEPCLFCNLLLDTTHFDDIAYLYLAPFLIFSSRTGLRHAGGIGLGDGSDNGYDSGAGGERSGINGQ